MKAPAFQFYPADFLVGVALFTNEEIGVYIRLLCYQWNHGRLPKDSKMIARLAVTTEKKILKVLHKFESDTNGFFNQRLEIERKKQEDYRNRQALNGQRRWVGNAKPHSKPNPIAQGLEQHDAGNALQSSVFSLQNTPISPRGFQEFWDAYPKKKARGSAIKAWRSGRLDDKLSIILTALMWQKKSPDWLKDGGQFIPHPATYLRAVSWLDEPIKNEGVRLEWETAWSEQRHPDWTQSQYKEHYAKREAA